MRQNEAANAANEIKAAEHQGRSRHPLLDTGTVEGSYWELCGAV